MSTPNVHQERRDFLIETGPYKSVYECATAFYNQFKFNGRNAGHDALLKSMQGVQSEAAYQGFSVALQTKEFLEWELEWFRKLKEDKKMSMETVIARQQRRVEVTGITKSQQVMVSGINLLGDGAIQTFADAAATSVNNSSSPFQPSTKSKIPVASPVTTKRIAKRKNSAIAEPWRSVVQQLLEKIKGGDVALAEEWPNELTGLHKVLYKYIEKQVQGSVAMTKLVEQDVFVAMSGIVNGRMSSARDVFGEKTLDLIKTLCLQPHISNPSEQLQEILIPLQEAFEAGGTERLTDVVEAALGVEASARMKGVTTNPLKRRILDAVRHICLKKPSKAMGEGELVEVWSYVMGALAGYKLSLRSGELTSKATRWQRLLMQQEYDVDTGSATHGRKLDLQCRVDEHELNNSEFKVDGVSEQQVEVQYRKNLRVNQAMMLYLKEQIGMPLEDLDVLALDVHGLSPVLFALRYNGDVFVSDLATKHMLRLPDSSASWKQFLRGNTLSVLLAYVKHLLDLTEQIEEQKLKHEEEARTPDRRTPEREPRPLGGFTFLNPSKRRCNANSQQVQEGEVQDDEAEEGIVQESECDDFQDFCDDKD
ncbi:hypothetical protein BGZ97_007348 [Linnemannia gamsii]|uniref:Uncharacterized protein n=1 Tax=Linnemannia gamsii TaxID=64522 RepID=A0A9P6QT27_9FUNG|nr:hypothetical protein BGZ97_007348 [Linnemannia gamsii]